ncbi:unnamed protein product, partial [Mesorhabditis spiculigera]
MAATSASPAKRERSLPFDPEDPNYIKDLQRPAVIKADLTGMERRKRVQEVLEHKDFCNQLEEVIRQDLTALGMALRRRIDQYLCKTLRIGTAEESDEEPDAWIAGIDTTDRRSKSQGIYNHITVRHPENPSEILINPFGLLYHEITASSLIKVDLDGQILDPGTTKLGINEAAFTLHSALHSAREDGNLDDEKERASILESLGDKNVMIVRNQGFVACGSSVEETLHFAYNTILACETQIRAARAGIENLHIPDEATVNKTFLAARQVATSYGSVDESDPEALAAHKLAQLRKEQEKIRWLNSPNAYQKEKQRAIKEDRMSGKTSAGPQSQVLDGTTYQEARDIRRANSYGDSLAGPADRFVMIGTASKGIIDRQHQHNAQVYRQLYAPNPFSSETDENIKKYFREVEAKYGFPDARAREHRMREESSYGLDELSQSKALDVSGHSNTRSNQALSEDEAPQITQSETKKKKKRGFFSFMRMSKRDKHREAA